MSEPLRTMVHFPVGDRLFNYRVAGIVMREGRVLVCREDEDDYVMLPGGRVELGEPTFVALQREIAEELHTRVETSRLVFTAEDFFSHGGRQIHELAAYYLIELPAEFPFRDSGIAFETEDEGHLLKFEWVPVQAAALHKCNLKPDWMIDRLPSLPDATEHLVMVGKR